MNRPRKRGNSSREFGAHGGDVHAEPGDGGIQIGFRCGALVAVGDGLRDGFGLVAFDLSRLKLANGARGTQSVDGAGGHGERTAAVLNAPSTRACRSPNRRTSPQNAFPVGIRFRPEGIHRRLPCPAVGGGLSL